MKALIGQKKITEYEFNDQLAGQYIYALQQLHSGGEIPHEIQQSLKKAGLYSSSDGVGKLRVFNYKKPKAEMDYLLSNEIKFMIPGFDSAESMLWYKPRFKFQREALQALIDKYGFRKSCYLIYVMIPAAKGVEYVPQISNPSELLSKLSRFSDSYQKSEIKKNKKSLIVKLTSELENKLKQYDY